MQQLMLARRSRFCAAALRSGLSPRPEATRQWPLLPLMRRAGWTASTTPCSAHYKSHIRNCTKVGAGWPMLC
eukprot:1494767-Pleurochrysis_carterae.AAC.4